MLKLFGKSSQEDWLIAGLGNPEPKYDGTRHNAGFAALDELARRWDVPVTKAKFQGLYGIAQQGERKVYLLKPMTYMNLSGNSIGSLAAFYKIPPQRVIVLCDDIDQQPGKLRIRPQCSAGGHNGLKSIVAHVGTKEFPRVRIGIGRPGVPGYEVIDWVLGRFSADEAPKIKEAVALGADAVLEIVSAGTEPAMNKFNGHK